MDMLADYKTRYARPYWTTIMSMDLTVCLIYAGLVGRDTTPVPVLHSNTHAALCPHADTLPGEQ